MYCTPNTLSKIGIDVRKGGGGAKCLLDHLRCALGKLHSQKIWNFSNQFPGFWWDLKDFYKCFHKTSI